MTENNSNNQEDLTRRSFLTRLIIVLGGVISVILGGFGGGYFLSPIWGKKDDPWIDIGPAGDFKSGMPMKTDFTVRKRDAWSTIVSRSSAWIITADQKEFIAFDPKCTHLGCPFNWNAEKKIFICPCHTATFGVDGKVISGPPPRPLDRYPTKVVGERLFLLPQAEKKEKGA